MHRRAGKTVACVHDLQRAALSCTNVRPRSRLSRPTLEASQGEDLKRARPNYFGNAVTRPVALASVRPTRNPSQLPRLSMLSLPREAERR
jgi:hypothetical protein